MDDILIFIAGAIVGVIIVILTAAPIIDITKEVTVIAVENITISETETISKALDKLDNKSYYSVIVMGTFHREKRAFSVRCSSDKLIKYKNSNKMLLNFNIPLETQKVEAD